MSLLNLIFPPHCLGCNRLGAYLCSNCLNRCQPLKNAMCPICRKGSPYGFTHPRCQRPYSLAGLTSTLPYRGLTKKAVTKFKYKYVRDLTDTLTELMTTHTDFSALDKTQWLVTPVPLHPRRYRWRGFNQSQMLAQSLAHYTHWSFQDQLIKRHRYTPPQMKLNRQKRLQNLIGAFSPDTKITQAKGKSVLLVDDVWTTGTTLKECAKVLLRNGAGKVWAFTLARA